MILAIDYDGTFDRAPALFRSFVANAHAAGFAVICITNRRREQPIPADDAACFDAVIYAGDQPKRKAALEAGIPVTIWVDDLPETIGTALLVGGKA